MNDDESKKTDVEILMANAWSSDKLKKQQTSLTKTINAVIKHKSELAPFSDFDELEAIDRAIATLNVFKQKVCHAKEKKARAEKAERLRRNAIEAKLKSVVEACFNELSIYEQAVQCCSYPYSHHDINEMLTALENGGIEGLKKRIREVFEWNWLDKYMDRKAYGFSHQLKGRGIIPPIPITKENVLTSIKDFNMAVPECRRGNVHEVCASLKSALSFSEQLTQTVQSA